MTGQNAVVSENGRRLRIEARAEADAEPGPRTLEIRAPTSDRVIAARRDAVTIRAAGTQPPAPQPGGPAPPGPEAPHEAQPRQPRGRAKTGGK